LVQSADNYTAERDKTIRNIVGLRTPSGPPGPGNSYQLPPAFLSSTLPIAVSAELKRPWREADQSSPYSMAVKNEGSDMFPCAICCCGF